MDEIPDVGRCMKCSLEQTDAGGGENAPIRVDVHVRGTVGSMPAV